MYSLTVKIENIILDFHGLQNYSCADAENENIGLKNLFDGIETMASLMMIREYPNSSQPQKVIFLELSKFHSTSTMPLPDLLY